MWAHSAGVLTELARRPLPQFDVVIACSAGSCTVAFWIAGQPSLMERVWDKHVHGSRLIRYRNLFRSEALMRRHAVYNESLEQLEDLEEQGRAFIFRPQRDLSVSRFTRERKRIQAAIRQGRRDAASTLARFDLPRSLP